MILKKSVSLVTSEHEPMTHNIVTIIQPAVQHLAIVASILIILVESVDGMMMSVQVMTPMKTMSHMSQLTQLTPTMR